MPPLIAALNSGGGASLENTRKAAAIALERLGYDPRQLREIICVEHPRKIILLFQDGRQVTAGPHTKMAFGYVGEGTRNLSSFLSAAGFAFTDATQFYAPRVYRRDGSTMNGTITGDEICWTDGTKTRIPEFPEFG